MSSDNLRKTVDDIAKETGRVVVRSPENVLHIDIDSRIQFEIHELRLKAFQSIVTGLISTVKYRVSHSGNLHVYIFLSSNFSIRERLMLQSFLGSDPVRDILSFRNSYRKSRDDKDINVFFEPPNYNEYLLSRHELPLTTMFTKKKQSKDLIPDIIDLESFKVKIDQEKKHYEHQQYLKSIESNPILREMVEMDGVYDKE